MHQEPCQVSLAMTSRPMVRRRAVSILPRVLTASSPALTLRRQGSSQARTLRRQGSQGHTLRRQGSRELTRHPQGSRAVTLLRQVSSQARTPRPQGSPGSSILGSRARIRRRLARRLAASIRLPEPHPVPTRRRQVRNAFD